MSPAASSFCLRSLLSSPLPGSFVMQRRIHVHFAYCFRFFLVFTLFLLWLSYVQSRALFSSHFRSFFSFTSFSPSPSRFGSRTDAQNGDAKRSFARNDARWIMWAAAETGAQTTIPEMEMPEVMAAPTSATQTPSALQCPPHQDYL